MTGALCPVWLFRFHAFAWYAQREYRRLRPMAQRELFP